MPDEVRITPWVPFPLAPYDGAPDRVRIWNRLTPFGMYQRHEWGRPDGTTSLEPWIVGGKRWAAGAVAAPAILEDVIEALIAIAEGHNDPRTLARDVLAAGSWITTPSSPPPHPPVSIDPGAPVDPAA